MEWRCAICGSKIDDGEDCQTCPPSLAFNRESIAVSISPRQLATILAALRIWQHEESEDDRAQDGIATDCGRFAPLDNSEIDALCERLNGSE
jgi:hypothetical protein